MYAQQPKKLLIMNILNILQRYTDENHRLSQQEIRDILRSEYNMDVDRKSVKRNLMALEEFGYRLEYSESIRMVKNAKTGELEENTILSDFYLSRDFTDSELRLLIDSLLFSKHIPYSQCRELVEKLEKLSSKYFQARVRHIRTLPEDAPANKQLFYTIDVLDEAISKSRQVSFHYNAYGTDKKLHPRLNSEGKPRQYIINPYQMVAANGRYYLICNLNKYDDVGNYRLDRISDIRLLDAPLKPMKQVKGLEHGLDLPRHMAEHVYMFGGESGPVTFKAKKYLIGELVDWFGNGIQFTDETKDEVTARVTVNYAAMRRWALQYALHVRLLSPESLVEQIREDIKAAVENYTVE